MFSYLGLFAIQYLNIPYLWGGDNAFDGYDCSGLMQDILKEVRLDQKGDQTAQGIYDFMANKDFLSCEPDTDCLLFFGRSIDHISHIALALNDMLMIEAGGGNHLTTDVQHAKWRNARVRIKPISNRHDLVASIKLEYSPEELWKRNGTN